ncbi:ABC transporter substrate-binding protein [Azospirillum picis]|uniref:Branched-chain amino acid transport system substrate-binding protein n=1 Tax=Azospirillum picis TaxID=488438 RepID=A0ABU0MTA3_9PROT|nr:ABC transporter substrate-binding protein [Azospirillum picis]MBP2302961.1 branched-chain amino acid transport system substrate-binding protein [Azospirillum picis]MDQ0536713.1 branched-chain amino acid transport system substrate-binding protein [Azospirillum picis]
MMVRALACALALTAAAPASAQISDDVVRIGVLTDLSSWGRDNAGPGSVEAVRMAVEEFGPTVAGKKIEIVSADHQEKPDLALEIAREWLDTGKVDVIADVQNSAIGIAIHNLVREKNRIALLTAPGSSTITDRICSPNTVHFTYDTYALAKVAGTEVVRNGGKSWFFLTADYAFGHQLQEDATRFIKEAGGSVVGAVRHPTGNHDFSSFLLQAQSSGANVVAFANAGADTDTALKQAGEFGITQGGQQLAALLMFITDVHAVGLQDAQGAYMVTASYWNLDQDTRAWSRRFFERTGFMPSMIQAGGYSAVMHYLKAVRDAGTDDAGTVMQRMRDTPINDVFVRNGRLREDGRVIRDMYLARVKKPQESKEPWDYLEIVKTVKGEDAFRPVSESQCPLLKR